jgi:hypothetical protein
MTTFPTTALVRLTAQQRAAQPEIGDAVGKVLGQNTGVVEVEWPTFRSWHKDCDLEPVS